MSWLSIKLSQSNVVRVFILLMLILTAYSFCLKAGFNSLDDQFSIVNNERLKDLSNLGRIFSASFFNDTHYYRPMVEASFWLEYQAFKFNPFFYHLDNILLHAVNAFLVFILISMILRRKSAAFLTALLFAIHPLQSEAVVNIAGRSILLSCFFGLISFISFLYLRRRRFKLFFYLVSIFSFLCALLSKESAAMLLILFISYAWFIDRKRGESPLISFFSTVPYFIILVLFIYFRKKLGITDLYHWGSWAELGLGFTSFLRGVLTGLRLYIYPVGLYFDRSQEIFVSFLQPQVMLTGFWWITVGGMIFKLRHQLSKEALFFLSWFALELFPVSQIVTAIGVSPGYISLAEHFFYIPSIAVFGMASLSLQKLFESNWISPRMLKIAVGGFVIFIFLITIEQTIYAGNITAMYKRSAALNPHNGRVLFNLGLELAKEKKFVEAEYYFRRALEIDPFRQKIRIALGKSLCDQGKFIECIQEYRNSTDPGENRDILSENMHLTYEIIYNQAKKYEAKGDLKKAVRYYEECVPGGVDDAAFIQNRLQKLQQEIESP